MACGQECLHTSLVTTSVHSAADQIDSAKAEQRKNSENNHRQADEMDNAIHELIPSVSSSVCLS
jgi:hypothetical protein